MCTLYRKYLFTWFARYISFRSMQNLILGHTERRWVEDDFLCAPVHFSSCLFIPRAHFETSLVMVSYYDYEI